MEVYCTRPHCPQPRNHFADLGDQTTLKTVQQKYCTTCGMPLILDGRYLPIKLLGKGGFGAAFLARDRRIPGMRPCVVKQFQPAGNLTATQLELAQQLFEREADVLAQLGNEHEQIPDLFAFFPVIVPSLQPGQQSQFFYLAQEYIDGQNLEEELSQKGSFSEPEVLEVLQEILKILTFVHHKGIIHRDIKPSNIMRRRDGKLFLLDFGAVKLVTTAPAGATGASTGIFSMGFAPPEQMAGRLVFPSTDLYALAVTALTLLTGQEASKLFDVYSNQWQWREQVNVSLQLADVLDKMLLPAANQRFQSAQEVLDTLALRNPPQALPATRIPPLPQTPPSHVVPAPPQFSTLELLGGAAFSGFEGALIAITLFNLLQQHLFITVGVTGVILAGLIFAQIRRWIEGKDLLIIPTITFALIYFIPLFQAGLAWTEVLLFAFAAALATIAFTSLFRLIYKLLSLIL
jgi:serine/threonine protein kinase